MLLDRRQFLKRALLLSGVAAAAGAAGYSIHSNIMEVTQHLLTGILPKGQMLKIAVVSDFHAPRSFVNPNELAALVNEAECDALFIVGDTIDDSANLKLVPRLFENIKVSGSKFAVLGNWEHWSSVDLASLSDAYDAANVQLLVNEGSTLELESNQTTILGLDDLVGGEPDFELVESAEGFRIVLTHCPASFDHLRQLPEETLVLSGHTASYSCPGDWGIQ